MQDLLLDHSKAISKSKHQITRICLTGGPCAGKTTALATMAEQLTSTGFKVLQVPEAATLMMAGGCFIQTGKMTFADGVKFQINLMKTQMILEDIFLETALQTEQKTILICDRGVMDGQAYVTDQVWQALLDETGWSTIQLRDRRYEAVIHLETAANGAEKFYTGENNKARYESSEEARALDKKLIDSWTGHPAFYVVDNLQGQDFQEKVNRAVDCVFKMIGMPTPQSYHKKFLLLTLPNGFDIQVPKGMKKEVF